MVMLHLECQKIKGRSYTAANSNYVKLMGTLCQLQSTRYATPVLITYLKYTHPHIQSGFFFCFKIRLVAEIC